MKKLFTLILIYSSTAAFGQFITPNSGVIWNIDSLVLYSDGAVTSIDEDVYQINEDIDVALSDAIVLNTPITVRMEENVTITIAGSFEANSFGLLFTAMDENNPYRGFRFEEGSSGVFRDVTLEYGGGIKVLTENFQIEMCQIQFNDHIITAGAALEISNGKPIISNNFFLGNSMSAVSSAANASVAPVIDGNVFQANVMSNTNRPQINLGPSGAMDTTLIVNNTIIGFNDNEMAGGIAVSSLVGGSGNVIIRNNFVNANRYGIAIVGNGISALIDDNVIMDNDIQNEPFLGGSGINFNGNETSSAIVSNNLITGNLWGITIQNSFSVNVGDNGVAGFSPGMNTFNDNGNEGQLYALFNNTPNEVYAQNNCWSTEEESTLSVAESVISHQQDDATLGEVFFDPVFSCFVSVEENTKKDPFKLYPNPSDDFIAVDLPQNLSVYRLDAFSSSGENVPTPFQINTSKISVDVSQLETGLYYLVLQTNKGIISQTFIKQ